MGKIIKMAIHYRTRGFIIKKADRGEADQLLTIYTRDFGKLEILGKAIRKIKSKLRGGAELFYLSEIEFIQGKTHKTLTDAVLIENFKNIRNELTRLKITYQIADLLDDLVVKEEKDEKIWELLNEVFEKLNDCELRAESCKLIYYYFFWNLVSLLGYQPELRDGAICGKKINVDIFKILRIILKKDWKTLSRLKIESSHLELLKNISEWYNKRIHEE